MGFNFKNTVVERLTTVLLLCLSACTPSPLDVHGVPQIEPKIVISSQLLPDYAVAVLLTKSIGALQANADSDPKELLKQIIITDAVVRLEGNGRSYELKYIQSGVYGISTSGLEVDKSYTLYVETPSLGKVQATTIATATVHFKDVMAKLSIDPPDTLAAVNYSIKDSVGRNWYMINAQRLTKINFEDRLLDPRITTKLFDDSSFEGTVKQDSFKLFSRVYPGDTISVLLSNINEDYYNFMKKREDTRLGLANYLGEPVNYPTNVEGGLGFFTLCIPDVRRFTLK